MSLADRLRALAERLPPGGSLRLTRDGLLNLAASDGGQADQAAVRADFTVAELAARFHRSASTVRDWCEHDRLEGAYKLNGRDWRMWHRAGVVEYRVEHYVAKLGERLAALNLGTTIDTTALDSQPNRVSRSAAPSRA